MSGRCSRYRKYQADKNSQLTYDGQTEGSEETDHYSREQTDVLEEQVLPVGPHQLHRVLQPAHHGRVDHGEVDGGREDVVPDDEINEGVGEPVDLLHSLAVVAGIAEISPSKSRRRN